MTIMELGALGEFLGVFALVATLIYLAIQVRHARNESEKVVLISHGLDRQEAHRVNMWFLANRRARSNAVRDHQARTMA